MSYRKSTKIIIDALKDSGMSKNEAQKLLDIVIDGEDDFSEIPEFVPTPDEDNGGYPNDWAVAHLDTVEKYLEVCETVNIWVEHAFYVSRKNQNSHNSSYGYLNIPKEYFIKWLVDVFRSNREEYHILFQVYYNQGTKILWVFNLENAGTVKKCIKEMTHPALRALYV